MAVRFIPDDIVALIHADLLHRYGGRPGLRDGNLLASALAQPRMIVGGKSAHRTLFDKAAVYGYHICKDRPYVDGNKRLAFVLMDIFLQRNGWNLAASEEVAYSLMTALARGELTKPALAKWLREHAANTSA